MLGTVATAEIPVHWCADCHSGQQAATATLCPVHRVSGSAPLAQIQWEHFPWLLEIAGPRGNRKRVTSYRSAEILSRRIDRGLRANTKTWNG